MSDLCIICGHDLRAEEVSTCTRCVGRVRRDLYRIEMLYALLPAVIHAGYPSNTALGQPHGNDDTPLLGGTALVLSGAGTVDSVQPAKPVGNHPPDRSHASDQWESDPIPILAALESWVRDWAELRDEPLPSPSATITSETGFLIRLCGWAGASHPAFDEFAKEVQRLRVSLERVTSTDEAPLPNQARCFDCDARLRPVWTDEGLGDEWRCPGCRREYSPAEYYLALRAVLEAEAS